MLACDDLATIFSRMMAQQGRYFMTTASLDEWRPRILSILRIVAAVLFFEHGAQKILGFPAGHSPEMFSLPWVAGILELVGGALLILGLFTRPVAFLLSGEMAVGYWMVHAPKSIFPVLNGGDAAILFCFVFLYFVFAGPGPWSVDSCVRQKS
jgi:putative oxidoreductase